MNTLLKSSIISVFVLFSGTRLLGAPWPWSEQQPPKCGPTKLGASGVSSLSLASDEIIHGLLWDQPDKISSLSSLAKNPEYSNIAMLPVIMGIVTTHNVEKIASLKPSLVIAASFNRIELRNQIKQLGIRTIIATNFDSIEAISTNILTIGEAIGCIKRAKALAKAMKDAIISAKLAIDKNIASEKRKVLVYSQNLSFPSHGTLFNNLMKAIGLDNQTSIKGKSGWPKLSAEFIMTKNPSWLIIPEKPGTKRSDWSKESAGVEWRQAKKLPRSSQLFIPNAQITATSQYLGLFAKTIANSIMQK